MKKITIEKLWQVKNFKPNENQEKAILHTEGPLLLTAGPGSGKTRVLLWRTLNLIVFHDIKPEEIFLSTFTEKAALQLKNGLYSLLGIVTNETNRHYDLSGMALGTVHSICRRLLIDRRFSNGSRKKSPLLLDELSQYLKLYDKGYWKELTEAGGFPDSEEASRTITGYLDGRESSSRHNGVTACIALFNRFSEESIHGEKIKTEDKVLSSLLKMYDYYKNSMDLEVDLSLLQQAAYNRVISGSNGDKIFKHIIIDEYQDTNAIQEKLFFALSGWHKNICVVGDDDQSLYRFRGATVENLVDFEERCNSFIGIKPERIDLNINYRSRHDIVELYKTFINQIDWKKTLPEKGHYRIADKDIKPGRTDRGTSVVVSGCERKEEVYEEIAGLVYALKKHGKIKDYNECAFLFPYLKDNPRIDGYRKAFSEQGIEIYAPRAGNFFKMEEAMSVWGLFLKIFGTPEFSYTYGKSIKEFTEWIDNCLSFAGGHFREDPSLLEYVEDRKKEIETVLEDYALLLETLEENGLNLETPFNMKMIDVLNSTEGLSEKARKHLRNSFFQRIIKRKIDDGQTVTLKYIIYRLTSLDWSVLDLFYQLNGFKYFRKMYELAEEGLDEGPVCNLGLITGYLSRYMEESSPVITAGSLIDSRFVRNFFSSYTYALFRRGESEFENPEDPFPKGRVPFLTIHQAKGLEFPVVVLGSLYKTVKKPDKKEVIIRDLLNKKGEPLDKISLFDNMRIFYVALSRAKNLLILPSYTISRSATEQFKTLLGRLKPVQIEHFDISQVPQEDSKDDDPGRAYSYTGDYLSYEKCPRNYMIFNKYGFVPSRSQTMFFGSLVHQTIEDLHNMLICEGQ